MKNKKTKQLIFSISLAAFLISGSYLFSTALGCGSWTCPSNGTYQCDTDSAYTSTIDCFPTKCSGEDCTWFSCGTAPAMPKKKCLYGTGSNYTYCSELTINCSDYSSTISVFGCLYSCTCNIWDGSEVDCLESGSWTFDCDLIE
ncbi:MAG: hypothetical protein FVQ84_04485 [Planctomycetes bacterium]|nr:hypothetical protein [Planctomycetota bacterium]